MEPVWLIEADVYGAEIEPLLAEIRRQGMAWQFLRHRELVKGVVPLVDGRALGDGACVIFYGTFPAMRHIQLHRRWTPGGWCTAENLDCGAYYGHFGARLLNQRYMILPGVEAIRHRDWVFDVLARDGEVFVRPSGCQKLFVGQVVDHESFAAALAPARFDPATPVLIAEPKPIGREWRLVVANDGVIAASQYSAEGSREVVAGCPVEVKAFAGLVLRQTRWRPDPVFMLDICESDGGLHVIEINPFSTSWIYACDPAAVVSTAAGLAREQCLKAQAKPNFR